VGRRASALTRAGDGLCGESACVDRPRKGRAEARTAHAPKARQSRSLLCAQRHGLCKCDRVDEQPAADYSPHPVRAHKEVDQLEAPRAPRSRAVPRPAARRRRPPRRGALRGTPREAVFGRAGRFITSATTLALVVGGESAIRVVRTTMGAKNPTDSAPGTVHGDLALAMPDNLARARSARDRAMVPG
jgi:nucleoside diphosphate kinase